jgi:hypothetical protein
MAQLPPVAGRSEEDLNATFAIEDPAGVRPRMSFQRVPEPKSVKNRVHLDLAAPAAGSSDHADQIDAFVERLTALGAQRLRAVKEDGYFVVMAAMMLCQRHQAHLAEPTALGGRERHDNTNKSEAWHLRVHLIAGDLRRAKYGTPPSQRQQQRVE